VIAITALRSNANAVLGVFAILVTTACSASAVAVAVARVWTVSYGCAASTLVNDGPVTRSASRVWERNQPLAVSVTSLGAKPTVGRSGAHFVGKPDR
jgi:hypothetical protein